MFVRHVGNVFMLKSLFPDVPVKSNRPCIPKKQPPCMHAHSDGGKTLHGNMHANLHRSGKCVDNGEG